MKHKYDAQLLWRKYMAGECTEEEKAIVESWHNADLKGKVTSISEREQEQAHQRIQHAIRQNINQPLTKKHGPNRRLRRWAVAASLLLGMALTSYYLYVYDDQESPSTQSTYTDVPPGGNKAILKLANGRDIQLSEKHAGIMIHANEITYSDGSNLMEVSQENTAYNEMITPRGGQYQVVLADGTKVWLNAASSLRYPTAFAGNKRTVELNGEAYFEVAKSDTPFIVMTAHQAVEVLGTHFNINAYTDESSTITTLLEGSVRVSLRNAKHTNRANSSTVILKPNEQSILKREEQQIQVRSTNTQSYVAWKNGYFLFNKDNIGNIMRMISRWYDVDITYKPNVTRERINGRISRAVPLSEMLKMLELTGLVRFQVWEDTPKKERRIIVM